MIYIFYTICVINLRQVSNLTQVMLEFIYKSFRKCIFGLEKVILSEILVTVHTIKIKYKKNG
jgi:hypothetical protein